MYICGMRVYMWTCARDTKGVLLMYPYQVEFCSLLFVFRSTDGWAPLPVISQSPHVPVPESVAKLRNELQLLLHRLCGYLMENRRDDVTLWKMCIKVLC